MSTHVDAVSQTSRGQVIVVPSVWQSSRAVFLRDWRGEWRTRAALNASALFAIAAPIALSFNLATQKLSPETLAGCLWSVLLFAALVGLARAFVKEEENGTAAQLRLNCPPEGVLWGKVAFNMALLLATQLAAVPIFMVLLGAKTVQPGVLLLVLTLGDLGLAVTCTFLGAIASQARARGALFAALAVPLLLPLLAATSGATSVALGAAGSPWPALQLVIGYDVIMLTASWMLFDFAWSA